MDHSEYIQSVIEKFFDDVDDREFVLLQIKEDIKDMDDKEFEVYKENVLDKCKLCWDHKTYENLQNKEQEYDIYIQTPPEVEEGVLQCKKCKSRQVLSFQVQARSADEPMTTVAKCSQCGIGWTENN